MLICKFSYTLNTIILNSYHSNFTYTTYIFNLRIEYKNKLNKEVLKGAAFSWKYMRAPNLSYIGLSYFAQLIERISREWKIKWLEFNSDCKTYKICLLKYDSVYGIYSICTWFAIKKIQLLCDVRCASAFTHWTFIIGN